MSLQSRVLPALYNGVSQQPPVLRAPDQNEYEENTWASLATGVGKRPESETIAHISAALSPDAFIHHINRDTAERYIVVIDGGIIRVFDHETGTQKIVDAPGGLDYIAGPGKNIRAVTIADYTFIVNSSVVCQLFPTGQDQLPQEEYLRWLSNQAHSAASYAIPGLALAGTKLQYPRNYDYQYRGELASMEKLPETASNGDLYRITGTVETSFASYYVRRNGAVWDETVGPGLRNAIDPSTMPHCLVREADGTWTFAPFSWANRHVGDDGTNPAPTFIGRSIRDVFFYQNRLGFLVDENVVFSCAGDFGNFWRNTVLDYVDSDVIDVAVTTNQVSILNFAVAFNDGILVLADQTQFSITNGEDGLTPSSVAIRPVTNYEVNTRVRPVSIGTEVYFCGDVNGSSVVWEYTRLADNDATTASEITAHVPTYVPARLVKIVAAPNLKALFAFTGREEVYVYQFYWNGNEKLQSAWRKWTFGAPVIGGEYIDGKLYLLVQYSDGVYLERIDLQPQPNPRVLLDRRSAVSGVYDAVTNRTTFTLPFEALRGRFQLVRGWSHSVRPHTLIDPSGYQWDSAIHVSVPGNESGAPCIAGEAYPMSLVFSRQFPLNYRGHPVTTGRLQLRTFTVYFSDTAYFETEVYPYGNGVASADVQPVVPSKLAEFTGKVIGNESLRLNKPVYSTGSYSFQVYGDAAQASVGLTNNSHVQSTFISAEWEGFYFNRASA